MSYDRCVRCGSCLKICPIFDAIGEEQYSPRGKAYLLQIMDLIQGDDELQKEFRRLLFECTMCGRCEEVCSSDVDLLKVWHDQRAKALDVAPLEFDYITTLRKSLGNVKNIYGLPEEDRAVYWLDEIEDDVPGISDRVFKPGKTCDTVIFMGCLMSFRGTQIDVVKALLQTLEKLEVDYLVLGAEEFCCGHPLYLAGDETGAAELRKHNKNVIESTNANNVVTCCPGCFMQLSRNHNLKNTNVMHHTQFFDNLLESIPNYPQHEKLAYHDPCELHRICEVKTEPRSLLAKMNVEYKEMDLSCCGGGGLLRLTDPNLSDKIIQLRASREKLRDTTVVTACPSCREQLLGAGLKTKDIVELLIDSLGGK
jgi:heterodisulfide reductase subunit D